MQDAVDRRGRFFGVLVIAALWLIAGYLVLYYAALFHFGARRLHELLGNRYYNLLVPQGGFGLLGYISIVCQVWLVPVALFSVLVSGVQSRWAPGLGQVRRWGLIGTLAVAITIGLHFISFDGWPWLLAPALGDDTEFAEGYSGREFWSVREGMTAPEVLARIGAPFTRMTAGPVWDIEDGWLGEGEEYWTWSHSPHGGNFRLRALHFRDGRVVEKVATYHVD